MDDELPFPILPKPDRVETTATGTVIEYRRNPAGGMDARVAIPAITTEGIPAQLGRKPDEETPA